MPWQWVNDLFLEDKKKSFNWNARCPYGLCPGNYPVERNARLKFIQKISPLVYQYKCGYCSCLVNISVETPHDNHVRFMKDINKKLYMDDNSVRDLSNIERQAD